MSLFKDKYRIESARLAGYDYASPGEYFVTFCTKSIDGLFGQVKNGVMFRNGLGEIAHQFWMEIPKHHANVALDEFIIMPNHVHGIVVLKPCRDVACNVSNKSSSEPKQDCNVTPLFARDASSFMSRISPKRGSLGSIIRSYKSAVTNWSHSHGGDGPLWEPRFYDHIIRNGKERNTIRAYIRNNPAKWGKDKDLPYDNPFSSSRTP